MKVKVTSQQSKVVSVNTQGTTEVVSTGIQGPEGIQGPVGPQGPAGVTNISQATDVDVTNVSDGAVLVYASTSSKWTATTTLEKQAVEGGHY